MIYDVLGRPQVWWWSSLMFDDDYDRPGRYQYIIYDLLHPADWLGVADQRVGDVIRRYMIYEKCIDGDLWPHGRLRRRLLRIRIWYTGYLAGPELLGDDGELELKRAMFWYIIYGFHRLHKLWALWISTIFEKNFKVLFLWARVGAPVGLAEARPTRALDASFNIWYIASSRLRSKSPGHIPSIGCSKNLNFSCRNHRDGWIRSTPWTSIRLRPTLGTRAGRVCPSF